MAVGTLDGMARFLEADLVMAVRWKGGDLDRLLDERHAALVEAVARFLESLGWHTLPELSFSIYGERGSIDLVAWHAEHRVLLVIEVKSELASVEDTLRRHDQKARLAAQVVEERFGWRPRAVSRLLVLPDARTGRRRVAQHAVVFQRAYPLRGHAVRSWLRSPAGAVAALMFLSSSAGGATGQRSVTSRRVRRATSSVTRPLDGGNAAPNPRLGPGEPD